MPKVPLPLYIIKVTGVKKALDVNPKGEAEVYVYASYKVEDAFSNTVHHDVVKSERIAIYNCREDRWYIRNVDKLDRIYKELEKQVEVELEKRIEELKRKYNTNAVMAWWFPPTSAVEAFRPFCDVLEKGEECIDIVSRDEMKKKVLIYIVRENVAVSEVS